MEKVFKYFTKLILRPGYFESNFSYVVAKKGK